MYHVANSVFRIVNIRNPDIVRRTLFSRDVLFVKNIISVYSKVSYTLKKVLTAAISKNEKLQ